ncbi:MAG: nucleotide exchange factor GrpE [Firmicutes bacterium]|nr:nucleotide exchange factor GrpE [Bacillota bacterium]
MAILDFFKKKHTVQDVFYGNVLEQLTLLKDMVCRVENKQKEMVLQLEEIDEAINGGTEALLAPIVAMADIVYDFYYFSQKDAALSPQAQMMWGSVKENLSDAGVVLLEPINEYFNYNLHIAHSTVSYSNLPHECIIGTLKCGYVYENKILRRATVVVNRLTQEDI